MNFNKALLGLGLWTISIAANALMYVPINQVQQERTLFDVETGIINQGYRDLAITDSNSTAFYLYALHQNQLRVFQNAGVDSKQNGRLQLKIAKIDDAKLAVTEPVIANANKILFITDAVAAIMRNGSCEFPKINNCARGASLHFVTRGTIADDKALGAELKLMAIKNAQSTTSNAQISVAELKNFNLQDARVQDKDIYFYGRDSQGKAVVVIMAGANIVNNDSVSTLEYNSLQILRNAALTKIKAISLTKDSLYVLNNDAKKTALLRFAKDATSDQYTLKETITTALKNPQALLVLEYQDLANIYVSSADLSPQGAGRGIIWMQKYTASNKTNIRRALPEGENNFATIGLISKFYSFGNMIVALAQSNSQMTVFNAQDGELKAVVENGNIGINLKSAAAQGADPNNIADSVTNPSALVLGAAREFFYISSEDAASKSILRVSRQADLQLSVERLQKSSEPGRNIDFRVVVKNNGDNDVPLLRLNVTPSSKIVSVTGEGASACTEGYKGPYTKCDPQQPLAAGASYTVTFTMRPTSIGTAVLSVEASSFHEQKGAKYRLTEKASIDVGDYHNGALAMSGYAFLGLSLLLYLRRSRYAYRQN